MEPKTAVARFIHLDPAHWEFHVRRDDGTFLGRPAIEPGSPPGNTDPWTRRIPDSWAFDSPADAKRATESYGVADGYRIIPCPRRGGEWLKGKGAYATA